MSSENALEGVGKLSPPSLKLAPRSERGEDILSAQSRCRGKLLVENASSLFLLSPIRQ